MSDDFEALPLDERVIRYRRKAEEALSAAQTARIRSCHDEFMRLARGWHDLAMQVEQTHPAVELDEPKSGPA